MKVVLAEKPSVARSIAECLGISNKQDGYFLGNGMAITWAFGHLVQLFSPEDYTTEWKSWKLETLPMIPRQFQLKANNNDDGAKKQLAVIKSLFSKATEVVCATDAGREGELIFRYIFDWCGYRNLPVKRLWISSLTDEAIRTGFKQLQNSKLFDNLYHAAKCRSEADWLVGLNATRAYTIKFAQGGTVLSVGRVQTPVLAMIVQRDTDIIEFVPKDFWELIALYKGVQFQYTGGRFESKSDAENLFNLVNGHHLTVTDVSGKNEKVMPPLLYDLTNLQKDLNTRHGFTADTTLSLVQSLYEKKHVTYPRTDSRYLSSDMKTDVPKILESLRGQFTQQIAPLPSLAMPDNRYFNDAKVTDHHAIIPTTSLPNNLSNDETIVYQAICLRFISAFYSPCIKQVTTVQAVINNQPFKTTGTIIESQGWQVLYKDDDKDKDIKILPPFVKSETGSHQPKITQGKTTPPKLFTEATLLAMMESAGKTCEDGVFKDALKESGLGTPATRAAIIETLIKRGFIIRQKNNVVSTLSGRELIKLIQNENLKSAALTGEWEHKLKQIEKGEYSPELFMREIVDFTTIIKNDVETINHSPVITNSLGDCPLCDGKVIETPKSYSCSNWKTGCQFTIWKVIAKKQISTTVAKELLTKGKTKEIKGFIGKNDKVFDASLKLVNGKISFVF